MSDLSIQLDLSLVKLCFDLFLSVFASMSMIVYIYSITRLVKETIGGQY